MKIESIHLKNFKRFTDLKIQNIPATAKLVVLLGPNGCGKSSLFEALHYKSYEYRRLSRRDDPDYYFKIRERQSNPIHVEFHKTEQTDIEKAIYVRTAYRNDPLINMNSITRAPSVIRETRFNTLIENDAAASGNFQRLVSNAVESAFNRENRSKTLADFQDEILGEIQVAMSRLFPDLILNSLGNPLNERSFTFDKGTSRNFLYKTGLTRI